MLHVGWDIEASVVWLSISCSMQTLNDSVNSSGSLHCVLISWYLSFSSLIGFMLSSPPLVDFFHDGARGFRRDSREQESGLDFGEASLSQRTTTMSAKDTGEPVPG